MKPNYRTSCLALALLVLAGCQKSACDQPVPSSRIAAADLMIDCFDTQSLTRASNVPSSGTATYRGFAAGNFDTSPTTTDTWFGDLAMTAQFGAGTISGSVKNIASGQQGAMTGQLALGAGTIAGKVVTTNITGSLGYGADTLTVNGSTAGKFYGDRAGMIGGLISGTSSLAIAGHVGTIDGTYLGER